MSDHEPWLIEVSPEDAFKMIEDAKVTVIDVREVGEFADAHIAGALLHPLSGFEPAGLPCDPNKPVLFHCAAGKRSAMAAEHYRAHYNCDNVMHIAGGLGAWAQAGMPVKKG